MSLTKNTLIFSLLIATPSLAYSLTTTDLIVYQNIIQQQQNQAIAREQTAQKAQELQLQQQQLQQNQQKEKDLDIERCKAEGRLVCF